MKYYTIIIVDDLVIPSIRQIEIQGENLSCVLSNGQWIQKEGRLIKVRATWNDAKTSLLNAQQAQVDILKFKLDAAESILHCIKKLKPENEDEDENEDSKLTDFDEF